MKWKVCILSGHSRQVKLGWARNVKSRREEKRRVREIEREGGESQSFLAGRKMKKKKKTLH